MQKKTHLNELFEKNDNIRIVWSLPAHCRITLVNSLNTDENILGRFFLFIFYFHMNYCFLANFCYLSRHYIQNSWVFQ